MKTQISREIGFKIKARREKLGITQNELSRILDVSFQAVSKWERGENAPDIALLAPLSKALKVTADWLLGTELKVFAARSYIFAGLSSGEIQTVLGRFESRYYQANEIIYQENQKHRGDFYLIEEGEVEITRNTTLQGRLKCGDIFSDYSFFDNKPCITTARALTESFIHNLNARTFEIIREEYPRETMRMLLNELERVAGFFREND